MSGHGHSAVTSPVRLSSGCRRAVTRLSGVVRPVCVQKVVPSSVACCDDVRVTVVNVLGPVMLRGPDGPVRLGSVRGRRLLAALAAHLRTAVSIDLLAELIWGVDPRDLPADPAGAVHTHVARLRRLLPAEVRIITAPDGYLLAADRALVDSTAFVDRVSAASQLRDPAERAELLAAALALWRGRPYPELDHPSVHPEIARLVELRSSAIEQHAEALLAAGRAGEAAAAMEALTVAEPLRESAVALLMRALAATGRPGDALAAYTRLRTRLAEELGLDPGPQLQALEQRVLRHELPAHVAAPVAATAPAAAPPVHPPPTSWQRALPISSFVGRDADLRCTVELLDRSRIVTLCGPGGVGKTRLATHVAFEVADGYRDGALLVDLGEGGPDDVGSAVASALRLSEIGAGGLVGRVVEVLAVREQLMLLDNCEHVADEVAALVEAIVAGAPKIRILATSREPLRVDGEHVVRLTPLDLGFARELLLDRIRAADPLAEPDPDQDELVTALCERLDGLPLALELAAGRAVQLGLRGLLAALDRPLEVLRGGRRTAAARHRSLRDVVEWSYGMLDDDQRRLFDRLSVFAGPVEAAAIEVVCGESAALGDLVDRSLVVRQAGDPARFGMLETLRAFGRSRLAADPEGTRLRERHAAWAVRLADEIARARCGPGEPAAVRRFDAHLAELRRAHAWLIENGPVEDVLRLGALFGKLAFLRGRVDLVQLLEASLRRAGALQGGAAAAAHPLVAHLLGLLAATCWQRGRLAEAEQLVEQALAVAEAAQAPTAACEAYQAPANVLAFRGDLAEAADVTRRTLELAERAGDVEAQFMAFADLTLNSAYAGQDDLAGAYEDRAVALAERIGSPTALGYLAYVRGERRAERGDPEAAHYLQAAIHAAEQADCGFIAGIARHTLLTSTARSSTEPEAALAVFAPLIDHWHGFGAWTQLWIAVRALIETLARLDRHRDVAVLLGALWASPSASPVFGPDAERVRRVETAAREALGEEFEQLRARGAALGDAGAVALVRRLTREGLD